MIGGLMERLSRSDWYSIDTDQTIPPYSWAYIFFCKTYISIFQKAIKIDCLVLANYQNFY